MMAEARVPQAYPQGHATSVTANPLIRNDSYSLPWGIRRINPQKELTRSSFSIWLENDPFHSKISKLVIHAGDASVGSVVRFADRNDAT